jgi:hypothetical protein
MSEPPDGGIETETTPKALHQEPTPRTNTKNQHQEHQKRLQALFWVLQVH